MSGRHEDSAFRSSTGEKGVRIRYVSPADAPVLDALLDRPEAAAQAGGPSPEAAPADAARRARISQVLSLLDYAGPDESGEEHEQGVRAALAAVQAARQRERFATQVQMLTEPEPSIGIGWRQVAMAAAVFVVAVSLLFPVLEHNRSEARRIACASNLRTAFSEGFGAYATDYNGMLPRGEVRQGNVWWNVGQRPEHEHAGSPSNTAHLFILIHEGYVDPATLACPENSTAFVRQLSANQRDWPSPEAVSYSYQNQYRAEPLRLNRNGHLALLADRNPLFVMRGGTMTFDRTTPRTAPSRIHDNRGQNVLTADGGVRWTLRPLLSVPRQGDGNIWVADNDVKVFTGRELPASEADSFLVP
ncbi:MAG: hypothetical protein WDZ31_11370 [Phycisphaeraceae bacterium]